MPFSVEQQENNLVYFLNEYFDPAARAARGVDVLEPSTRNYFTLFMLEAFLWLHLGVKLKYFPEPLSRRVIYEYGNHLLGAYQRTVDAKQVQKFSPPHQRILEAELTGRVPLFASAEEIPVSTDEIACAFQNSFILVSRFATEPEIQQLLKMLMLAQSEEWNTAVGKASAFEGHQIPDQTARGWARNGLLKVVEFMQAYRDMLNDFDALSKDLMESANQMFLLKRQLKEMQQWRLDFVSNSARERFLDIAKDVIELVTKEIKSNGEHPPPNFESMTVSVIYDLLTDWGAPFSTQGAVG